ncbi:MAG: hypothetical protein LBL98_07985 [Ruminococcus sp.]|jgi:hypothetical protein|nr:hypothetical protein [Ruminococcus sp.]
MKNAELESLEVSGGGSRPRYVLGYEAKTCAFFETDSLNNAHCEFCKKAKRTGSSTYCTCEEAWK